MQQRALTEFFGARPGVGAGGGADGGGGGDARVADGSGTMRAMYTPNVTGRNHYAIRKKDYNPTEAEAKAFFNITEVVGTFLTVGRRVTGNTFTRMASHRIVAVISYLYRSISPESPDFLIKVRVSILFDYI